MGSVKATQAPGSSPHKRAVQGVGGHPFQPSGCHWAPLTRPVWLARSKFITNSTTQPLCPTEPEAMFNRLPFAAVSLPYYCSVDAPVCRHGADQCSSSGSGV